MQHLTTVSLFLYIIGIFTSVSALGVGQVMLFIPALYIFFQDSKSKRIFFPKSTWFLISFIVIIFISFCVNYSELLKPFKSFGRLRYFALGVLLIPLLRNYFNSCSDLIKRYLMNCLYLCLISVGFICFYQVIILNQDRAKTLTDTLRYGYGMGMLIPLLLGLWLRNKFIFSNKFLLALAIFFSFCSLYLTFTRGAMLGLICSLPFVIYFWNRRKGILAFGISGSLVLFLGGFYLFGTGEIGNRFISSRNNKSDNVRYTQWKAAYKIWTEKPILGIGLSEFINKEQAIKIKYGIGHTEYKGHAHNTFLEILAGTGILGLVAFLGWLLSWGWELIQRGPAVAGIYVPFIVSMFIGGQFEVLLDANNLAMICLVYALSFQQSLSETKL